jgi:hypothetical protein
MYRMYSHQSDAMPFTMKTGNPSDIDQRARTSCMFEQSYSDHQHSAGLATAKGKVRKLGKQFVGEKTS